MAKPLQLVFDKLLKKEWRRVLIRRASLRRDGRVLSTISLNTEKGGDDFGSTVSLKKGMTSSGLLSTSFLQLVIRLLQRLASEIKSFASCRRTSRARQSSVPSSASTHHAASRRCSLHQRHPFQLAQQACASKPPTASPRLQPA